MCVFIIRWTGKDALIGFCLVSWRISGPQECPAWLARVACERQHGDGRLMDYIWKQRVPCQILRTERGTERKFLHVTPNFIPWSAGGKQTPATKQDPCLYRGDFNLKCLWIGDGVHLWWGPLEQAGVWDHSSLFAPVRSFIHLGWVKECVFFSRTVSRTT